MPLSVNECTAFPLKHIEESLDRATDLSRIVLWRNESMRYAAQQPFRITAFANQREDWAAGP